MLTCTVCLKIKLILITRAKRKRCIRASKTIPNTRAVRMELNTQAIVRGVHIKRQVVKTIFSTVFPNGGSFTSNVYLYIIIITVRHVTLDVKRMPWQLDSIIRTNYDVILAVQVVCIKGTFWKGWWWYFSIRSRKCLVTRNWKKKKYMYM